MERFVSFFLTIEFLWLSCHFYHFVYKLILTKDSRDPKIDCGLILLILCDYFNQSQICDELQVDKIVICEECM